MAVVISLGSISADFEVRSDEPASGPGTLEVRDLLRTSGGKGANVAVLAARLGAPTMLLGCVGDDDLAGQALAGLERDGIALERVRRRPGPTGYASIVVPTDGGKTILRLPGANDAWGDEVQAVHEDVLGAPDHSILVVDLEVAPELVRSAVEAARRRAFPVLLDPAPPARVDDDLLRAADHLTPDHQEATELTGIEADTDDGARDAAVALQERGGGIAYVKLRDGGCVVASAEGVDWVRAPEVEVVDQTGAGDAFAGGLAWALVTGRTGTAAAALAVAASTCAVTGYGSQESYPTPDELAAMAARVSVAGR